MRMKEIGQIRVFEDEALLSHITKLSAAVFVSGVALAVALFIEGFFRSMGDPLTYVYIVFGLVLSVPLHEAVHALFFKAFAPGSAKIRFGANRETWMVYASAEGVVYSRAQYLAIALAPTFAVTLLCLAFALATNHWGAAYFVALGHLTGCVGDWCYVERICKNKAVKQVEDTDFGVRFYGEEA